MEKFHIVINNKQEGPFSIMEIEKMNISPNTLVWNENYSDWVEIKSIKHFKNKFKKSPPPIPNIEKDDKAIKVIITKDKKTKNKRKINFEKLATTLLKLSAISFGIAIITFIISSFGIYDISKFDNYDYSKVTMTESGGYNFPLDEYSPKLLVSLECKNDGKFECLKRNVVKRKENIASLSLTNSLTSFITSYLIIGLIFLVSKDNK